jgi:hypothetical protein
MSAAVAVAMGVSSGMAGAGTGSSSIDPETLPAGLTAELIDEALVSTAGDKGAVPQASEERLMVADRAFGLGTAATHSGKAVPPKKKRPPKKKPPKKKAVKK